MIYNVKYATDPILIVQGDDIDLSFNVQQYNETTEEWEDYDLTVKSLRFVIVNNHGTIIADWTTVAGDITIALSTFNISAAAINAITCCGSFSGQLIEVAPQITLWKSIVKIMKGLI